MAESRGSGMRRVDRLGQARVGSIGDTAHEFHQLHQTHQLDRAGAGVVPCRSSQGLVGSPGSVG
jgi:hypothetical protein